MSRGYAVLDLETTGLFPGGHDRVVEIAVLHLDEDGVAGEPYSTLVNPERDLGPTSIHGLTGADVLGAPTFREIGGEVLRRLRGRVVVGHNVGFDLRFLKSEFSRMSCLIPPVPCVCTMQLVRRLGVDVPSHRLPNCCAAFGVPHEGRHSALADAQATAALFREIRIRQPSVIPEDLLGHAVDEGRLWPEIETLAGPTLRADAHCGRGARESLIGDLVARLPLVGESPEAAAYQALLERVLEDRHVSREEASALDNLARASGLGQDTVRRIHESYLEGAVVLAAADGVVTERETRELNEFALLLGLGTDLVERLVTERTDPALASPAVSLPVSSSEGNSLRGCTVCFTGELQGTLGGLPISRETAHVLSTNAGLMVSRSVTKRLDLLVVADADSLSLKARKAREYGTRIMVESVFWRSIGAPVD